MTISKRSIVGAVACLALAALALYQVFYLIYLASSRRIYRGFMLDTARVFFNASVVKAIIDQLAIGNYTHLHLGLSNDERFSYLSEFDDGRLAKAGGNTQYYTRGDILQIVEYGHAHGIVVYGEIEFMAHAAVWKSVYPGLIIYGNEFDMGNPNSLQAITNALDEIIPLFDAKMWHFANDEISQPSPEIEVSLDLAMQIAKDHRVRPVIWDDPITQNDIEVSKRFMIQCWHDGCVDDLTTKGYNVIVSEMSYWYIGGSDSVLDYDASAIKDLDYVHGAELVWFTNSSLDDPNDLKWVFEHIHDAAVKMQEIQNFIG